MAETCALLAEIVEQGEPLMGASMKSKFQTLSLTPSCLSLLSLIWAFKKQYIWPKSRRKRKHFIYFLSFSNLP
jgi:hypothetical protein